MSARRVAVVPHTHWDREWYESFQSFRLKLVDTVDFLLDLMERDPAYSRFMLDGQMAAVDDYLEVRPEAEGRLRELCSAGRLTMGPWYALMDEFLVSGETIVRDLQMGMRRATAFGGAMSVGYLPDMFGHVAQMPQLLRLAGMAHAVVWRGVPSSITKTGFIWEAPDGSSVRAEYLPVGYGNGSLLPDDAKALVRRVADHETEIGSFLLGDLLLMNGSDHLGPQPALGRLVAEANGLQDEFEFRVTSIPEYLADAPTEGLEHWTGELRSGARANILMGVTSNRIDVKRAAASAERALERRAEPYAALFLPAASWPARSFEIAWKEMSRNAAHDSACACSVDSVVDAVLQRYSEASDIADGLANRALGALALSMAAAGSTVVNPSARRRSGVVELVTTDDPGDEARSVQVLSERGALPGVLTLDAQTVRTVLGMIQGPKIDDDAWVQHVSVTEDETGVDVVVTIGAEERPGVNLGEARQDLYTRLGARPDVAVRVQLDQPPIRRVVAKVAGIPGFGWRHYRSVTPDHPVAVTECDGGSVTLDNGLVQVAVNPADGTWSLGGVTGMGRLVDGGDLGDSYNYSPPAADRLIDTPETVAVSVTERGPVRAKAVVTASYRWPDHVDGGSQRRKGEHVVEVTTVIELRADETAVRVATSFINPARDHRLRVHLPLPTPTAHSLAECAFGTTARGLAAEGRPDEYGLPTFPARRFVQAGGLTLVSSAVAEYELVDIAGDGDDAQAATLAVTLLRSTGMLSRLGMSYRPFPAGPLTPVEGLQLVGKRIEASYAVAVGDVDPWALADDVLIPLEVIGSLGGGTRGSSGSELEVTGAEVSAVQREAGVLEVRVFNPTATATTVGFGARSGWLVDLRGRPLEPFDGSIDLRPHGIATVRLAGS